LCPEGEIKNRKKAKRVGHTPTASATNSEQEGIKAMNFAFEQKTDIESQMTLSSFESLSMTGSGSDHESTTSSEHDNETGSPVTSSCSERESMTWFGLFDQVSGNESEVAASEEGAESMIPFPPGLELPKETQSLGSALHATGNCRPCAWFWKPIGCQNDQNCTFCHLCPEGAVKARKKSRTTQKLTLMRLGLCPPKADSAPEHQQKCSLTLACLL